MRLRQTWMGGFSALFILSGAAFADVTVSQSNDPSAALGSQLSALLGQEHSALEAVPDQKLEDMADSVDAPSRQRKKTAEADIAPVLVRYETGWLEQQPTANAGSEWKCLATALYFEARGESVRGQFAVAEVILNRVDSADYPNSICSVVNQGAGRRNGCQFSFACDGAPDTIREATAFQLAGKIATVMLSGAPRALTQGATHFHTRNVRPGWAYRLPRTATIGAHFFYRQPS